MCNTWERLLKQSKTTFFFFFKFADKFWEEAWLFGGVSLSDRCVCFTQVGCSWRAASPAAPCAGCIRTSIQRLSAPRRRSDRLPGEKLHLLLLPCSCTWPDNFSVEFKHTQRKWIRSNSQSCLICMDFPTEWNKNTHLCSIYCKNTNLRAHDAATLADAANHIHKY